MHLLLIYKNSVMYFDDNTINNYSDIVCNIQVIP